VQKRRALKFSSTEITTNNASICWDVPVFDIFKQMLANHNLSEVSPNGIADPYSTVMISVFVLLWHSDANPPAWWCADQCLFNLILQNGKLFVAKWFDSMEIQKESRLSDCSVYYFVWGLKISRTSSPQWKLEQGLKDLEPSLFRVFHLSKSESLSSFYPISSKSHEWHYCTPTTFIRCTKRRMATRGCVWCVLAVCQARGSIFRTDSSWTWSQ
jgi:hypothetical protein